MSEEKQREPFERAEVAAQRLARRIDEALPQGYLFLLFVVASGDGPTTYVSNVERDGAVLMVQEWLERMKAQGYTDTDIRDACWTCGSLGEGATFKGKLRNIRLCEGCLDTGEETGPVG